MKRTLVTEYEGHFGPFFQKEAARTAEMFSQAYVQDGVVRWKSNDRVPSDDILELWYHLGKPFKYQKSLTVSKHEQEVALAEYAWRENHREKTAEELAEMRVAFGPGATVVNVLTGEHTQL